MVLKSTGAVLAGFVVIVALSTGTDFIMESSGVFPSFKEQFEQNIYPLRMLIGGIGGAGNSFSESKIDAVQT